MNPSLKTITIFGVDPGTRVVGFGWIEVDSKNLDVIVSRGCGVINATTAAESRTIGAGSPEASLAARFSAVPHRLSVILRDLQGVFAERRPDIVVVEKVFLGKNVDSAFVLGQGRGVVLAVAAMVGAQVREEAAKTAKKSVTGRGSAEKTEVRQTLGWLLGMSEELESLPIDASDGLALAYQGWRSLLGEQRLQDGTFQGEVDL